MDRRQGFLTGIASRRLIAWTVGILIVAGIGAGIAWRVVWPAVALAKAEQALNRHDLADARARLDVYLARWPGEKEALLLAARAARRSDACADAERFLTEYENAFGHSDASRLEWALLGAQQGDFMDEEDRLRSYVNRNHPDTTAILEALAKGYAVAYRRREAIATLNQLLKQNPSHVPALLLRGKVYESLRKADEAEEDFRRAVEHAPENAATHAALAEVLNQRGHTREAIYHYEYALQRGTNSATHLGLARALTDAAELDEAERQLDELLTANPECADGLVELGRLALRRKRFAEAEPFLARAVRAAPWHRDGHQLHLLVLKELGRSEAASKCETRLAELRAEDGIGGRLKLRARDNPGDTDARWDLWLWSLRNGQEEEKLAWLTEILRTDPRHAQAHKALAEYFEQAGQPRRAALHREAAAQQGTGRRDEIP
jgi:Tfp pilus assembly protein PilF